MSPAHYLKKEQQKLTFFFPFTHATTKRTRIFSVISVLDFRLDCLL